MSPRTREELFQLVARVRNRWRLRMMLQGMGIVLGAGLIWLLLGGLVLQGLRFDPTAVTGFRIGGYLVLAAVLLRFILLPLLRRVTNEQIARYIEEHEPGMEALLVSAVEQANGSSQSAALAEQVVAQAISRIREADDGRRIEATRLKHAGAVAGAIAAVVLLALLVGPATLK
ncbi:MAG TPA: hypothetical protein VFO95_14505, partial [Gemmatimonadales bacterium]|nr:hypothetical protein [Gemmatimonadales bacterium]